MNILKHPVLRLIFLSLSPLAAVLLQTERLDFPTVGLAGAPYTPWPRLFFVGLLLCVVQGLSFWLLRQANQSAWLNRLPVYARIALRIVLGGVGLLLVIGLLALAVIRVLNEWTTAQTIYSLNAPQPQDLAALLNLTGRLAVIEVVIVGSVWIALFANWFAQGALAAERSRLERPASGAVK
jgi:hypothetical protein